MKIKKILLTLLAIAFTALCVGCGSTASDSDSAGATALMTDFSAQTIDGATFTQKDLASYDLTMVNIWTTWCGYCVDEMPELQKVYDNLPQNVNMITVCGDASDDVGLATDIVGESGGVFPVLIPDDKLTKSLLSTVSAYPTTVFVDKNGYQVGEAQVGVPGKGDGISDAYLSLINDRLGQLK